MSKILYFDIETAPNTSYTWGKWEQNVLGFIKESYLLCYSYAWNDGKVKVVSLPEFESYIINKTDDKELTKSLWELLNQADIVIAHNGKQFDIKYANGRFLAHNLPPPQNYQVVDTLTVARSKFKLNSNKLDDIAKLLHLGRKAETGGFDLWLGCMAGEEQSWAKMRKYNKQDVVLLREVYKRLRGWMKQHPNLSVIDQKTDKPACSVCSSLKVWKIGYLVQGSALKQRWRCQDCGANLYTNLKESLPLKN